MINLDLFDCAINLLSTYKNTLPYSSQVHVVGEAVSRLKHAKNQYSQIIKENDILLKNDPVQAGMRKYMSDDKLIQTLQEQSKNDPELAKFFDKTGGFLVVKKVSEGSSYDMSKLDNQIDPQSSALKKLHFVTEEFYENLWLIIQALNQLLPFKNYLPRGVRDVRNHLIVHTKKSGAHIFSFGVTTSGPLLRPIKSSLNEAPNDNGFDSNVSEFLNGIISKIS